MKNPTPSFFYILLFLVYSNLVLSQQFVTKGNAVAIDDQTYRLTRDAGSLSGMITSYYPLDLTKIFSVSFKLNFGTKDSEGADGFAFMMTNTCNPALKTGGGLGVYGQTNSLIAKFDTFYNEGFPYMDTHNADHTAIYKNGSFMFGPISAGNTLLDNSGNVENNTWYDVEIKWEYIDSNNQKLSVYFNNSLRVSATKNHIKDSFQNKTDVFWSISASTGSQYNEQKVQFPAQEVLIACQSAPVKLTAPLLGKNYVWTDNSSTTNEATYTSVAGDGSISCSYKDYCGDSREVKFKLKSITAPSITNDTAICEGDTAKFTINTLSDAEVTYSINGEQSQTKKAGSDGKLDVMVLNISEDTTLTVSKITLGACTLVLTSGNSSTVTALDSDFTFTQVPAICEGETLSPLPTTSDNGISGTWAPALNNMVTTTYTFTPNSIPSSSGPCATSRKMSIIVNPKTPPTFTQIPAICEGETLSPLPTTSNNGITGTWSPAFNNLATTTYTFTPDSSQCASGQTGQTMTIEVNNVSLSPIEATP